MPPFKAIGTQSRQFWDKWSLLFIVAPQLVTSFVARNCQRMQLPLDPFWTNGCAVQMKHYLNEDAWHVGCRKMSAAEAGQTVVLANSNDAHFHSLLDKVLVCGVWSGGRIRPLRSSTACGVGVVPSRLQANRATQPVGHRPPTLSKNGREVVINFLCRKMGTTKNGFKMPHFFQQKNNPTFVPPCRNPLFFFAKIVF